MKTKTNRILRKILSIALCLALVMSYAPIISLEANAISDLIVDVNGDYVILKDSDSDGYYDIGTVDKLNAFSMYINNTSLTMEGRRINAELTNDIAFSEKELWIPIGYNDVNDTSGVVVYYDGIFDGKGHTISGLNCSNADYDYVGLFGYLTGTVKNVSVVNSAFNSGRMAGGIAGYNVGVIEKCYFSGAINGSFLNSGGITGLNGSEGEIRNCYSNSSIVGSQHSGGGIVGSNSGIIENCYSVGNVTKSGSSSIGGIAGRNGSTGTITNCYYNKSVYSGNLIGTNEGTVDALSSGKTTAQFKSGEVTYLLQGDQSSAVWGQTLGVDDNPVMDGEKVYYSSELNVYTNYEMAKKNSNGFYEINNVKQLMGFAEYYNAGKIAAPANAVLTANINLSGYNWTPIGTSSTKYKGVFDGQGHTISNFNMTITGAGNWGLFGYATGEGTVIKNFSISGDVTTALTSNVDVQYGVVGQADGTAEIRNVHSSVNLTSGDSYQKKYFGGIVGRTGNITVDSCSFSGKLSLDSNTLDCVGGIAGYVYNGKTAEITNCGFYGTIESTYSGGSVGGILGYYNGENAKALTVSNCLSVGTLPEGRNAIVGAIKNYGSTNAGSNNYYLDGVTNSVTNVTAAVATQTQLASGEIAIALGDAWGQMSNTEGSLPIVTDNELYKVVTVGETGNYSVANVGDTNGDGTVDVTDYQAVVNTILADNHEQIETASYDDIVKYDLDGDGYLDVIDASLMHLFINGFTTVDVYAVGDYDLNGIAFEEADIKAIKHAIENPEKLATYKKYASDINGDGKLDENDLTALTAKYGEVTGTECADNVEVYYSWGNKYSTCTATAMCTLCGEKVAVETVNTTSETLSESTCTQDGKVKYTATFQNELFEEKIKTVTTDMLPHNLSDGVCTVCGIIDATNMTADELETAVTELFLAGKTNITVALAEDAEQEMFSAIRTAFSESTAADGSINLTVSGAKTVPDYGFFDIDDYYDNDDKNIAGDKLKSLTLTDVETIGDSAFSACTYLESVNLPQVVTIGECAFNEWEKGTKLTSLNLPNATTIGDWAFAYSSLLTSVNLPKVVTIATFAFADCDLRTLDLPEATTIGGEAFLNNYNLASCSAPKATTIDYYPWGSNGTSKLERLELTAVGDFTLYNNLFAYTPTEQIDLVLNKDKERQVTQNDDGTATWKTTNSNGGKLEYTFKSITFVGE